MYTHKAYLCYRIPTLPRHNITLKNFLDIETSTNSLLNKKNHKTKELLLNELYNRADISHITHRQTLNSQKL